MCDMESPSYWKYNSNRLYPIVLFCPQTIICGINIPYTTDHRAGDNRSNRLQSYHYNPCLSEGMGKVRTPVYYLLMEKN